MNRLTKTYEDGSFGVANDLPCGENSHQFKELLINKMGEYESLGSPEELYVIKQKYEIMKKHLGILLDQMLAEFDKDSWCRLVMEEEKVRECKEWFSSL